MNYYLVCWRTVYASGNPLHRYWTGRGSAIHKSPKQAVALAKERCAVAAGDGASYGYVLDGGSITNLATGKTTTIGDGL